MNAELINRLRDVPCWAIGTETEETMLSAADALEAADIKIADYTAAVEALDDSNDAYIKENERLKKRIAELEAQLPKEGEWITADNPPKNEGLYLVGLSVGWDNEYVVRLARYTKDLSEALFSSKLSGDGWYRWDGDNDCDVICHPEYWMELPEPPNCGARMKKGERNDKQKRTKTVVRLCN